MLNGISPTSTLGPLAWRLRMPSSNLVSREVGHPPQDRVMLSDGGCFVDPPMVVVSSACSRRGWAWSCLTRITSESTACAPQALDLRPQCDALRTANQE